jgi:hypothetical protein
MATRTKGSAVAGALLAVQALRCGTEYRAAELLRRSVGSSKQMAANPETTKEHAAVRLLIGTWNVIGTMVRQGDLPKEKIFETNPVSDMWEALSDAVGVIRQQPGCGGYAEDFEWLYKASLDWMKKNRKSPRYRSGAGGGVQLLFG